MKAPSFFRKNVCFTLVELLVSMAILSLLLIMLGSMVTQTSSMWSGTRGKIEQFREARTGFEAMTRRISQATLNTYWDYEDSNHQTRTSGPGGNSKTFVPAHYARQSELRFISGPSSTLLASGTGEYYGHAIFFQAPLGEIDNSDNYGGLQYLLNTWGYYIEYSTDTDFRPSFVVLPERKRFRLMEFIQPSESINLYRFTTGTTGSLGYTGYDWFVNTAKSSGDMVVSSGTSLPMHTSH